MLNAYFDCLVPVIVERGGQVLKFLGDGLLATFPLAERAPAEVCETGARRRGRGAGLRAGR